MQKNKQKNRENNIQHESKEISGYGQQKKLRLVAASVISLSLLANIALSVIYFQHKEEHQGSLYEKLYSKYPFLSKRVFQESPNDVIINFVPLRLALRQYVEQQGGKVGVYFEYLPSGVSIGANEKEEVRLASLSKVPLAMAILKKAEKGGLSLNDEIALKKEDLDSKFGDLWKAGEGATFTVKELLEESLKKSDNTAYEALFRLLTDSEVVEVYSNLEVEVLSKEDTPYVSPKSYSSIFRSLYLSSFLKEEDSHYILKILTETVFNDKIPAGILDKIPVSHKIGVFSRYNSTEKVFSDCGIIYVPQRPYILCVFVQGEDVEAKQHISYISKMVYSYVALVRGGGQ